jgi:hypothetical protein
MFLFNLLNFFLIHFFIRAVVYRKPTILTELSTGGEEIELKTDIL